jgi:hypothetical protein
MFAKLFLPGICRVVFSMDKKPVFSKNWQKLANPDYKLFW